VPGFKYILFAIYYFISARYYTERAIATAKSSVRLSLRDVEVPWSDKLEIFKNNFSVSLAWGVRSRIYFKGNTLKFWQSDSPTVE